jgi:hypothetical protein
MTPSQSIVRDAVATLTAVDAKGRQLLLRRLTALDTLRLFKAAGPTLAENEPWLSMAGLAFAVLALDGVPVPAPMTEGLAAIAATISGETPASDTRANVGNSHGTPS